MTFFSVDIETSDARLGRGRIFTIGAVPVSWSPGWTAELVPDTFYVRLDYPTLLDEWRNEPPDTDTYKWWSQQSDRARAEAYEDPDLLRSTPTGALRMLTEFVRTYNLETEPATFVANPVAFDKGFIDELYGTLGMESPFHYRSLCLRSMKFGMRFGSAFGNDREDHAPKIPHHALSDAIAQAHDLISMLNERDAATESVAP